MVAKLALFASLIGFAFSSSPFSHIERRLDLVSLFKITFLSQTLKRKHSRPEGPIY
jgi:hypothetical protein